MARILQRVKLIATILLAMFPNDGETNSGKVSLKGNNKVCDSARCRKTAKSILASMNEDIKPCEDFYSFSCGGFMKRKIPKNEQFISFREDFRNLMERQIKSILKGKDIARPGIATIMLNRFMNVCESSGNFSHTTKLHLLKDFAKFGGFPVLNSNWKENSFDLSDVIGNMTMYGYGKHRLIKMFHWLDEKTGKDILLTIDEPNLLIDRKDLLHHSKYGNNSKVQKYLNYMVKSVNMLGADKAMSKCDMQSVLNFLMSLAKITMPPAVRSASPLLYTKMTVRDLAQQVNNIDWKKLMSNLYGAGKINENDSVIVRTPKVLQRLNKLINKFSKRTLSNYLLWSMTSDVLSYVEDLEDQTNREIICRNKLDGPLNIALVHAYVTNYLSNKAITGVTSIVKNTINVVEHSLRTVNWMSNTTKQNALKKLRHFRYIVGCPTDMLNETVMHEYLSTIELTDNIYGNKKAIEEGEFKLGAARVNKLFNKMDWTVYRNWILSGSASYLPSLNTALMPAGYFHEDYYSVGNPLFRSYGLNGYHFAHELMHAFGVGGGKYDHTGAIKNWWSIPSKSNFNKRKDCIINQYSKYMFNGLKLNGRRTVRENLADTGGIYQAYLAYLKVEDSDKVIQTLSRFTKRQLYWISVAQGECFKSHPKVAKNKISTEPYTIAKYRVIGMISNYREFAADFNCSSLSPMNPAKKCTFL